MNDIIEYIKSSGLFHFPRNNAEISLLYKVIILVTLLLILLKIVDDFHLLSPMSTTESAKVKYGGSFGIRKDLNAHHGENKTRYKYYDNDTPSSSKTQAMSLEEAEDVNNVVISLKSPNKRRRRVSSDSNETPEMGPRYHSRARRRGSTGCTIFASSPQSSKSYRSKSSHSSSYKSSNHSSGSHSKHSTHSSTRDEKRSSSPEGTALDILERGIPNEIFFTHRDKREGKMSNHKINNDAAAHDTLYLNRINMVGLFPSGSSTSPETSRNIR